MAIVSIPDQNKTLQEPAEIKAFLAGIDIDYDQWELVELGDLNNALRFSPLMHNRLSV